MPNKETLRRWKEEGIKPPERVVAPGWKCPVCSSDRQSLKFIDDKKPEAIACIICDMPFSLPHTNCASPHDVLPLPAVSDDWITAWRLAFRDTGFRRVCRAVDLKGYTRMLDTFPSAVEAIEYFAGHKDRVAS